MAITYVSSPIKSTIKPLQDNAQLISQVAAQKQNKYDNVLNAIFQRENQLLNLDIVNEERNDIKKDLLKTADTELESMASLDFLNPENIQRAEKLFEPIVNNKMVMEGVSLTRGIRENQRLAQEAIKKDPSPGNMQNYRVSESLVEAHRVAKGDQFYDTAPYTTMFASYIDLKDKKAKFLKDYGVLDGINYKVTEDINGEKFVMVNNKRLSEDTVLAAYNASLTAADRHQLKLDGYSQFNSNDLTGLMQNIKTQTDNTRIAVDNKMGIVTKKILSFDSNNDGVMDKNFLNSPNAQDYQREFQQLQQTKSYYEQLMQGVERNNEYIKKFNENKSLPTGYKLEMFGELAQRQMAADFVALFAHPDGREFEYEYSNKGLFDLNSKMALKGASTKPGKTPKAEIGSILVDINGNGQYDQGIDILLPDVGYTVAPNLLTEQELGNKKEIAPLKELSISLKDGSIIKAKVIDPTIKNYQGYLHAAYKDVAKSNTIAFENGLKGLAYDPQKGGIDETKYQQIRADFGVYEGQRKQFKDDKAKLEQLQKDWKDKNGQAFELAYQFKTNFEGAGDFSSIDKKISEYVMNTPDSEGKTFKEKFENLNNVKFKIGDILTKDDFIQLAGYKEGYDRPEVKEAISKTYLPIYEKIKNVTIDDNEDKTSLLKKLVGSKILTSNEYFAIEKFSNPSTGIGQKAFDSILVDKLGDKPSILATAYSKQAQELYGQLVDQDSPLTIRFHGYDTKDRKNDLFYAKVLGTFNAKLKDAQVLTSDGDYKKIDQDKLKDISKDDIELAAYNTSNGEVFARVKGIANTVKIKLDNSDAQNGLPFGTQVDDFIGKNLMLEAIINKQKPSGYGISKALTITDALGNNYNIACNIDLPSSRKFFIYTDDPNRPDLTGASVPELEGKLFTQFAKMGTSPTVKSVTDILREAQEQVYETLKNQGTDYSHLQATEDGQVINVTVENTTGE